MSFRINTAFIRQVGPFRWAKRTAVRQFHKRLLKRNHTMQLPTGEWMTLPIADHFASEAYITQADVDWGSEAMLASMLSRKGAFLDVGAHIGYYGLYVLPRVVEVFCFEPDPRARVMLEKNVAGRTNMEVIPCAVGSKPGRARFTMERDSEVSHLAEDGEEAGSEIVVDVVTIDAFVAARGLSVEAIKIDVEGHDTEVIRGALDVLREQQPLVLTEARPDSELFALTDGIAYRVFAFVRERRTQKKWFAELSAHGPVPGETKMLFLVPDRMTEEFVLLAAQDNNKSDRRSFASAALRSG